jgi:hypothetical protein
MLAPQFAGIVPEVLAESKIKPNDPSVAVDPDDPDGQSLLFWYPIVTSGQDDYIRPAVKIESGAKSALDPNEDLAIIPYISDEVPQLALRAEQVTTVAAERTFWDKIVILHGVRNWFENRGVLRGQGQRVSRHYYDVHRIFQSELGREQSQTVHSEKTMWLTLACSSTVRTSAWIAQLTEPFL